jgi:hypothetical protein
MAPVHADRHGRSLLANARFVPWAGAPKSETRPRLFFRADVSFLGDNFVGVLSL